ncbi:MAG: 1-deoxy-D-xylulose-5-phosphate synthase [Ruminococcus sp.]|nr:1-deoxy-D-xylulose-5-phosphate synthase [Ruminococcus sp.]
MPDFTVPDLKKMKLPKDLKKLDRTQCEVLCSEIRQILIDTVSKNGGHLASNLGTVELTLAIHRVFESPKDKIVWDVGHQAYTHKLLTGRADRFDTIRQEGGLSGFCRPDESVHDAFISGHSSNSVSAALGIATAMKLSGSKRFTVAVLGDGAFTGGLVYEGLNNAGKSETNLVIILNHNEMSISKNVGSIAKYLSTLRTKQSYHKTKNVVEKALDKTPLIGKPVIRAVKASKKAVKNVMLNSTMFEDLGFAFIGPLDGHNIDELEKGLIAAKALGKPVVVHVNTKKGKGYPPAEKNPGEYHGIGSFEITTGNPDVVLPDSYSSVMGKELLSLAARDGRICAVTAAMKHGTGLQYFAHDYPDRFFDVGIAEEHAVTFCAGLASMGMIPVFAVYSTFLQRAYDELIHDLSICGTHTVLCVDRAGIVGEDGETHQGIFDIPMLTSIPNTVIYSPSCYQELIMCLDEAVKDRTGITAVRYPKGRDSSVFEKTGLNTEYDFHRNGGRILVVCYGRLYENVLKARELLHNEGLEFDILKLVRIFPIDQELFEVVSSYEKAFFFEECYRFGCIAEKYASGCSNTVSVALDGFVKHGAAADLLDECGLSPEKIAERLREYFYGGKT